MTSFNYTIMKCSLILGLANMDNTTTYIYTFMFLLLILIQMQSNCKHISVQVVRTSGSHGSVEIMVWWRMHSSCSSYMYSPSGAPPIMTTYWLYNVNMPFWFYKLNAFPFQSAHTRVTVEINSWLCIAIEHYRDPPVMLKFYYNIMLHV